MLLYFFFFYNIIILVQISTEMWNAGSYDFIAEVNFLEGETMDLAYAIGKKSSFLVLLT